MPNQKLFFLFLACGIFGCTQVKKETASAHLLKNELLSMQPLARYTVVFFVSSDCPLCKSYRPMIKAMSDSFQSKYKDWRVLVFHADTPTGPNATYEDDYGIEQFHDPGKKIAGLFHATVVPQVFLVDSMSNILYQGAIDNYAAESGKHRTVATEHYLKDAIHALNNGKVIAIRSTKPRGCYIE